MQLHNRLAYDCHEKLTEGAAGASLYYRSRVPKNETRVQRLQRVREGELWGNLVTEIGPAPEGSQWIHVFDRGGDNFEAMCRIRQTRCDWVIRAAKLNCKVIDEQGEKRYLSEVIQDAKLLGSYELYLRSRQGVKARTAHIHVSVARLTFPTPQSVASRMQYFGAHNERRDCERIQCTHGRQPGSLGVAHEPSCRSFDDAWQVIEDYENRWMVEEYHKVIKTGCNIEGQRYEPLTVSSH